ncbi:MAG: hypothetical protein WA959_28520, partial [Rivularia sp. (in: cyanobacteria)]
MGTETFLSHTESCEQATLPNFEGFFATELETNDLPLLNSMLVTSGEGEEGEEVVGELEGLRFVEGDEVVTGELEGARFVEGDEVVTGELEGARFVEGDEVVT